MLSAGREGEVAEAARDGDGSRAAQRRTVAPAAVRVVAPTVSRTGVGEPAGVKAARHEGGEGQGAGHRAWHQALSGRRTVAELPLVVAAPAVRHPGAGETAAMTVARGEGGEGEAPRHGDRHGAIRGRPGAELAIDVVAPTVSGPGAGERAGVEFARGERREAQCPARHSDGRRAVGGRSVAQSPVDIVAPAVGGPRAGEPAGVGAAGGEGGEREAPGHAHWHRAVGGRAVAQLALGVVAPAVGSPGRDESARVTTARAELDERQAATHGDRRRAARGRAVAQLAKRVIAPAESRRGRPAAGEPARVLPAGGDVRRGGGRRRRGDLVATAGAYQRRRYGADRCDRSVQRHLMTPAGGGKALRMLRRDWMVGKPSAA